MLRLSPRAFASVVVGILGWSGAAFAQAGGPELQTNDPYFPGEGAFSSPAKILQYANSTPRGTLGAAANRDKLIRFFLWRSEHFGHASSPAIYNQPGVTPNPGADNPLMTDYDAMRALFSYGFGLCGTNHAHNRVFADEAGWQSRRRSLVGDTGWEVLVDPGVPAGATGWRYCNTDQYTLHFLANDPTQHFASVDQVINTNHHYIEWNPDIGLGYFLPQANTHGSYQDVAGVTTTVLDRSLQWRSYYGTPGVVPFNGVWASDGSGNVPMYGEGYTATPVVVQVKRGETFTRWLGPDGVVSDLGLAGRLWWGWNSGGSPSLTWSFVQNAPARDQGGPTGANPEASSLVGQQNGNGCFQWTPNLAQGEYLDGTTQVSGTLKAGGSPALLSSGASTLVLLHNSPYTIAGRPSDGKDPANPANDGAVLTADTVGSISVEVSTNAGATWSAIGSLSGAGAKIDFTDAVKGRNQYLLRLTFADGQGLNALSLRTITMLNQGVFPNLKSGTAQISYRAANVGSLELSPDLWSAASANSATGYVQKIADSGNLSWTFYSDTLACSATDANPISLTYKITMPPQLASAGATWKQIWAGANATVRVTPSGSPYAKIEISPDQTTWSSIGEYDPPSDDQLSAYWAYGRSPDGSSLGGTTYYVRYTTFNGGFTSRLRYLRLSATYTTAASAAPLDVRYFWTSGGNQSSTHTVAAGATSDSWSISTGANVVQQKVVLATASGGGSPTPPPTPSPAPGGGGTSSSSSHKTCGCGTIEDSAGWLLPGAVGAALFVLFFCRWKRAA